MSDLARVARARLAHLAAERPDLRIRVVRPRGGIAQGQFAADVACITALSAVAVSVSEPTLDLLRRRWEATGRAWTADVARFACGVLDHRVFVTEEAS